MEYHAKNIASVAEYYFGRMRPSDSALRALDAKLKRLGMHDRPYACFMAYFKRTEGARAAGCTNLIVCDRLLDDYDSYYRGLEARACITTRADFDTFDIRMKLEENPAAVLENRHCPLSPLFRYIMGGELGLYGLAEANMVQAADQLAENPFFFKTYKGGFPVSLEELLPGKE